MKRGIIIGSILAVLMIISISYVTAVNTKDIENKESPLYGIRTNKALGKKITAIMQIINTKFLNERMFFIPFFNTIQGRVGENDQVFWSSCKFGCSYFNQ